MFRYVQDCPDCQGSGWLPCLQCPDKENVPCFTAFENCPVPNGFLNRVSCPRCNGMGSVIITETTDSNGTFSQEEVPDSVHAPHFKHTVAIHDFADWVCAIQNLEQKSPEYMLIYEQEFSDAISSGIITNPVLIHQLPKEKIKAIGLRDRVENAYLIIFGSYGFYLPSPDGYAYTLYEQIIEVIENEEGLFMTCGKSYDDENSWDLEILRTPENSRYIRFVRLTLEKIMNNYQHDMQVLLRFGMCQLFKNYSGILTKNRQEHVAGYASHLWKPTPSAKKKLRQVLFSYAAKIRTPNALVLIDASLDNTNSHGLVFEKDGFAFCNGKNHGFIPYESIYFITTNSRKTILTLHGSFDECWHPCRDVSFSSKEYHIDKLEEFFRLLLYMV